MNRNNGPCFLRYGRFNQGFIQIEIVRANIHKYRNSASENKGISGRYKCKGWYDDFVTGPDAGEDCRHLQRCRARMGQQGFAAAEAFFEPYLTLFCKRTIAGGLMVLDDRLGYVEQFFTDNEWFVERNHQRVHSIIQCV